MTGLRRCLVAAVVVSVVGAQDVVVSGVETDALLTSAARGETESLAFCVFAKQAVSGLEVVAGDLSGPPGARIPIAISEVEQAPPRLRPLAGPLDLKPETTRQFWITLKVPLEAAPGDYLGTILLRPAGRKLSLRVKVLPFRLDPPGEPFFGIFLNPRFLPTLAELQDLKERGFDALLWFWGHYGLRPVNEQGRLSMDFADLDRFLERVKAAGLKGPIVLALGNDSVGHYERALAQAFGLPLAPQVRGPKGRSPKVTGDLRDEKLNDLYLEGLRQLIQHGRERGWPELVLLPYDEPTEQLMEEYRHRTELIRRNLPGVRIYGVTMDRLAWAEEVVAHSDILVANGDFERIAGLARARQRGYWTYGSVAARDSFGAARFRYGLAHWRHRSQGIWFWGYNWYRGNPYEEIAWAIVYPPRPGEGDKPISTPAFEGMREGIDDVRYATTLERLIREKPSERAKEIHASLERLRADWASVSQEQALQGNRMNGFRSQAAEWIMELQTQVGRSPRTAPDAPVRPRPDQGIGPRARAPAPHSRLLAEQETRSSSRCLRCAPSAA